MKDRTLDIQPKPQKWLNCVRDFEAREIEDIGAEI
jgi:hypothetical protein